MTKKSKRFSIAMLLDGNGGGRDLTDEEVDNWTEADGVLWVDLDLGNKKGKQWLSDHQSVDKSATALLLAGETRPRSLAIPGGLVVILRGINMNPGAVPDDMVATRLLIRKNMIITTRRRKVLSVTDLRDVLLSQQGPKSAGDFLVNLTHLLSFRIESAVENIERTIEGIDQQLTDGNIDNIRVTLSIVRRQAAAIRRYLAPQRDAIDRISRSNSQMLTDLEVFELREEGDQLTRHIEDLDLARENALVTQEELMNRVALEQNSRMYLLSIVAAIFLPLTFVSGVLGMNVAGLPGTVNTNGFIYSAILMVSCLFGLIAYFRWRKWL